MVIIGHRIFTYQLVEGENIFHKASSLPYLVNKKKSGKKKPTVARPNFVVVELIFGSLVNMLGVVEWIIHINYSHHYASDKKGGTKREKERKKNAFFGAQTLQRSDGKLCRG